MSDKKIIQEMFDSKFDKQANYNNILSKVKGVNDMKKKILKFSLVPICLILIVCIGVFIKTNSDDNITNIENAKNEIHINKIYHFSETRLDATVEIIDQSSVSILEEFKFLENLKIPSDLKMNSKYLIYTKKDINSEKYDVLHDYVISYNIDDFSKDIIITFSKSFKPLRDYYINQDNVKISKINSTELSITNYKDMYISTFSYNNLNFDVETKGITQIELIELLESILK